VIPYANGIEENDDDEPEAQGTVGIDITGL
jgi:hypothetical protein